MRLIRNSAPLDNDFSIYLDLLRVIAAFAVLFGHMEQDGLGMSWNPLAGFGHEAVIVFFVLSGFIICQTTINKKRSVIDYFSARISRLYSVVIPAIVLCSILAVLIGATIEDPEIIFSNYHEFSFFDLILQFGFLTESWLVGKGIPMNLPFWSLCYEFWYYMLFGILFFYRGKIGIALFCIAAVIAGPAILVLFPIWMAGAWLAYSGSQIHFSRVLAMLALVGSVVVVILIDSSNIDTTLQKYLYEVIPGFWRLSGSQRFLTDYMIGAAVLLHLIAARSLVVQLGSSLRALQYPITFFARFSFTLYIFHRPLTQVGGWLYPIKGDDIFRSGVAAIMIVSTTYFISLGTERRLRWWRLIVTGLISLLSLNVRNQLESVQRGAR